MSSMARYVGLWLLLLGLGVWLVPSARGQSSTPVLENLLVEIWPEYDRSETLIIYRADLSADTPLPAEVYFPLPGYLEAMHVVAIEQNGVLVEVDPGAYELRSENDRMLMKLSVPTRRFQFEYYDPVILTYNDQDRRLDFEFTTNHDIKMIMFEVQEPFQALNFLLTPPAENSFTGSDGLRYNTVERTNLASGDDFELSAAYERNTNQVSASNLAGSNPANSAGRVNQTIRSDLTLAYGLVGVGILLLLVSGGAWWWSRRQATPSGRLRHKNIRAARRTGAVAASPRGRTPLRPKTGEAGFCYKCGAALRTDAQYCHQCGAERRRT